ncbi:hypothetical protein LWI29_003183 [Acer saccharum]|uniref:Uncharacterized protein n=1 Tax=Acer saccharum TaxID=4024 RepID=A0AA39VQ38_ACESA|nr:hypothetical protein LWI29_003183 [Acer saccharum]
MGAPPRHRGNGGDVVRWSPTTVPAVGPVETVRWASRAAMLFFERRGTAHLGFRVFPTYSEGIRDHGFGFGTSEQTESTAVGFSSLGLCVSSREAVLVWSCLTFRMLSGSSNRWVVVRLVGSSSDVRNSCVSGGRMAWVCKLLAQRNELTKVGGSKTIRYRPSLNHNDADQGSADVTFRTPLAPYEKSKSLGSGGSMVARLKLKGIDGRAPPGVEPAA